MEWARPPPGGPVPTPMLVTSPIFNSCPTCVEGLVLCVCPCVCLLPVVSTLTLRYVCVPYKLIFI